MIVATRVGISTLGTSSVAVPRVRRAGRWGGLLLLGAGLMLAGAGCGKSAKPAASTAAAEPAAAAAEEKEDAPAEAKAPAKAAKKKAEAKPAAAPEAKPNVKDPAKWQLADLQAGLTTHDLRFVPAVLIFSLQSPNGAERAEELRGLLQRAGQMKDDPIVPLPLPPTPVVTVTTGVAPAAAPAATPAAKGGRRGRNRN